MTFRVRSADRGRSDRDPSRRTLYMNIGFALTVIAAVVILVVVGASTWYGQHLAPAATVDGQTITNDQFNDRAKVEQFRLQQQASRIQTEVQAGRLTNTRRPPRSTTSTELDSNTFLSAVVEKLVDTTIQAKLATEEGVTVSDTDIDARILTDKTRPEERHVSLISVTPRSTPARPTRPMPRRPQPSRRPTTPSPRSSRASRSRTSRRACPTTRPRRPAAISAGSIPPRPRTAPSLYRKSGELGFGAFASSGRGRSELGCCVSCVSTGCADTIESSALVMTGVSSSAPSLSRSIVGW